MKMKRSKVNVSSERQKQGADPARRATPGGFLQQLKTAPHRSHIEGTEQETKGLCQQMGMSGGCWQP